MAHKRALTNIFERENTISRLPKKQKICGRSFKPFRCNNANIKGKSCPSTSISILEDSTSTEEDFTWLEDRRFDAESLKARVIIDLLAARKCLMFCLKVMKWIKPLADAIDAGRREFNPYYTRTTFHRFGLEPSEQFKKHGWRRKENCLNRLALINRKLMDFYNDGIRIQADKFGDVIEYCRTDEPREVYGYVREVLKARREFDECLKWPLPKLKQQPVCEDTLFLSVFNSKWLSHLDLVRLRRFRPEMRGALNPMFLAYSGHDNHSAYISVREVVGNWLETLKEELWGYPLDVSFFFARIDDPFHHQTRVFGFYPDINSRTYICEEDLGDARMAFELGQD